MADLYRRRWRIEEALYTIKRLSMGYLVILCRAKENQDLGVVKALRKPVFNLDLSPFAAPSQTLVQLS
ncbi:hypothetical protein Cylst_4757 [Cylindrospermum stagnale PCC 7417]|uniref:Uncharacterized protein n=1 Tax=Cylindrospermum stagnale PCC 7417 TaxID=56107 RepID=K9X2X9_9NOST|nr:hypothetical protein Cylst_4757 [Cylindrospermum stagnale PCC 7417]